MSSLGSRIGTGYSGTSCSILAGRAPSSVSLTDSHLNRQTTPAYKGPGYYIEPDKRWVGVREYWALPWNTKRHAVLVDNEDRWRDMQDGRLQKEELMIVVPPDRGSSTGIRIPSLLPGRQTAWDRPWNGAGYYVPRTEKWFRDMDTPAIPKEAIFFCNEEDWLKFQYMTMQPYLPSLKS